MNKILIMSLIFLSLDLFSAIPPKAKINSQFLTTSSFLKGGDYKELQSVLDIRHSADRKKNVERVVIDLGTKDGKSLFGEVGYYQVEYKKEANLLILDLAQTPISKITIEQLRARLKTSKLIRSMDMVLDPITNNLNLSMVLQDNVKPRVFRSKGQKTSSKIVVDVVLK